MLSKLLLFTALASTVLCQASPVVNTTATTTATFTNPIVNTTSADPWIFRHEKYYYLTYTNNVDITLFRSQSLTDWAGAESRLVFKPPPGMNYSTDLWAPEIHYIDNKWYVIFTADPHNDSPSPEDEMWCEYNCPALHHRMYVVEGEGPDPWTATYTYKSQLDTYNQFAIDGTYFQHNATLYHIYSCWHHAHSGWPSNLCITRMANPYTISSPLAHRQLLSTPTYAWEKTPFGRTQNDRLASNEAPQQLVNPATGQHFVLYSAARSDNRNYCLAQLQLTGSDPMNPAHWHKHPEPVFFQNPAEAAYGVGHASFTTSPSGDESWIVYHGMQDPANGWAARTIRAQRFTWNPDGTPRFPRPGYGPYAVPAGQ